MSKDFHTHKTTPPLDILQPKLIPAIIKLKDCYNLWQQYIPHFPKTSRYTLGQKIDALLLDAIESISVASFLEKKEKLPYVRVGIKKLDVLKVLLHIGWDNKFFDIKKYVSLSEKIGEAGKMLGGWHNQLVKQNSPAIKRRRNEESCEDGRQYDCRDSTGHRDWRNWH